MLTRRTLPFLLSVVCYGHTLDLPSDFRICKRFDPNINECLKDAIQDALPKMEKGLPDFNFPSVQPLHIPSITIGEGTGAVHLKQKYKKVSIYNIVRAKIDKVNIDIKEHHGTMTINSTFDEVKIEAEYDFDGRILVLPIQGKGNSSVIFSNLKSDVYMYVDEIKKKGVSYIAIKDIKLVFKPDNIKFRFDNLFNGDEKLGSELNGIINENWKELWEDVRDGYEGAMAIILQDLGNLIFKKIPYDKLFPI